MNKSIGKIVQLLIVLISTSSSLIAQNPTDTCNYVGPDPLLQCPIDDGVLFLIAAVLAIAFKKAYDYKQKLAVN